MPADVIGRAVRMARDGIVRATNGSDIPMRVDTICTHGDTPASHELTRQLRAALEADGIVCGSAAPRIMTSSTPPASGLFGWWREGTVEGRRALIAAGLGWMLDSFDVMLYALTLASIMPALGLSKETAGLLGSITLLAAAAGGIVFGVVADRFAARGR